MVCAADFFICKLLYLQSYLSSDGTALGVLRLCPVYVLFAKDNDIYVPSVVPYLVLNRGSPV